MTFARMVLIHISVKLFSAFWYRPLIQLAFRVLYFIASYVDIKGQKKATVSYHTLNRVSTN